MKKAKEHTILTPRTAARRDILPNRSNQGAAMRVAISHHRSKQEVVQSVDRSFNELFNEAAGLPVKLVVNQRSWQGSTMTFQLTAKMGIISTPIKGTVEVTDTDIIVDADLGMLSRFVSDEKAQQLLGSRIKGLLK